MGSEARYDPDVGKKGVMTRECNTRVANTGMSCLHAYARCCQAEMHTTSMIVRNLRSY